MTNQMKLFTKGDFNELYSNLRSEESLMAVLSRMQVPYGVQARKAYENADAMIRLVAAHENAANMLSDDALEVLNAFLMNSERMGGYDQKVLLHQLYFGLKIYQDEELVEKVKEGAAESDLFREYYMRWGEDPSITGPMLREEIRRMMGNYRISPEAMRHIVKQMEKSKDLRATATALGEEGMEFKAIVAMDLYLRNKDTMSMEEAAHIACTNVELQAVADGVSCGQITEERAKKILAVICVLCILIGIALAFQVPQIAAMANTVLPHAAVSQEAAYTYEALRILKHKTILAREGFLFGIFAYEIIGDKVAEWVGQLAAKRAFVRSAQKAATAAAMENMIARGEAEITMDIVAGMEAEEEQPELQKQAAKACM